MGNPKKRPQSVPPLVRQAPRVPPAPSVVTAAQLPLPVDEAQALLALRRLSVRRAQLELELSAALDAALAAGASYAAAAAAVGVSRQAVRERVLRRG